MFEESSKSTTVMLYPQKGAEGFDTIYNGSLVPLKKWASEVLGMKVGNAIVGVPLYIRQYDKEVKVGKSTKWASKLRLCVQDSIEDSEGDTQVYNLLLEVGFDTSASKSLMRNLLRCDLNYPVRLVLTSKEGQQGSYHTIAAYSDHVNSDYDYDTLKERSAQELFDLILDAKPSLLYVVREEHPPTEGSITSTDFDNLPM